MSGRCSRTTAMERRNCSCALPFSRGWCEYMMKKQRYGAWLPSVHGIREGVSTFYCRACGAFLHSSIDRLFPAECNGKRASCNGNPYRAMETRTSCNGKLVFTRWRRRIGSGVTPSEPGHMDNPIKQLHEQDALHRLVNAIDR